MHHWRIRAALAPTGQRPWRGLSGSIAPGTGASIAPRASWWDHIGRGAGAGGGGGGKGAIAPPNFLSEGDEYACLCPPPKFWQSL